MPLLHTRALGGASVLLSKEHHSAFAPHYHDKLVIALYRGGQKHFRCHHSEGLARRGDVLLIAPGVVHDAKTVGDAPWHFVSLYLTDDQLAVATGQEPCSLSTRIGSHQVFRAGTRGAALGQELLAAVQEAEDSDDDLALEVLLTELLSACRATEPVPRSNHRHLEAVAARLCKEPGKPVTLKELSDQLGVSREHFTRSFRAHFGLSPFQMLIAARAELARRLIQQGNGLAEAAHCAGFADQSHMTRWFRKFYAATPGQFARHQ